MKMLFNNPYMSPEEIGSGGSREELSADDILSKLNAVGDTDNESNLDESNESSKTKEEKVDSETDEKKEADENAGENEKDELAELEEELKEPTDEDLELKTPVNRRELKTKYPNIFKEFPGLESTIYRERAYTEILPTIADAKEALESVKTLESFDADLREGKTVDLMAAVKSSDPKGFAKLADNYMENLAQVDERAYHHVLGNIIKDLVEGMVKFGRDSENEDIQAAASILHQYAFNTTKWEGKKKLSSDDVIDSSVTREREELNKQRTEFEQGKQKEHMSKTMTSVNNQIKSTVEKSIDSKDQMTPFVKNKAIEEVMNKAQKLIEKDIRFQQIIKGFEARAVKEKFSEESMNRIRSTYLKKYSGVLLPLIKAVRNEALKGNSVKRESTSKIDKDTETNDTTERANRGDATRNNNGGNKNLNKPKPGESSLDFLLRRA